MSLTEQYFDKYKSIHGKFPDYFWQLRLDENDYAELKKKITSLGEKNISDLVKMIKMSRSFYRNGGEMIMPAGYQECQMCVNFLV